MKEMLKKNKKIINFHKKYLMLRNKILYRISPILATKMLYKKTFKRNLDLKNPKTFNEKIQWLKLYWQHPLITKCADKYEMIDYVKSYYCEEILNKLYKVYISANDVNFDELPNKFALKCTHGCGFNIICEDKEKLDKEDTIKKLKLWMNTRYASLYAEVQYDKMCPRIICEKFIVAAQNKGLNDYKIYCFNGVPKFTMACIERGKAERAKYYFYDNQWQLLPYNKLSILAKETNEGTEPPKFLKEMLGYCEILSRPFPFVRMDFYDTEAGPILGEMTFTPAGGLDSVLTYEIDLLMGNLIELPKEKIY